MQFSNNIYTTEIKTIQMNYLFPRLWTDLVHRFTSYMIESKSSFRLPNPSDALSTFLLQAPIVTVHALLDAIERTHTYKNL